MAREVKCAICGNKIEKDLAYCEEKVSEKTGKKTRKYYCSQEEFEKDKFLKSLWLENLRLIDEILGYVCISKIKVNELKEIEKIYSREQIFYCLKNNINEIKRYLDDKDIYDEFGKLSYIFACLKNKIKDFSSSETIVESNYVPNECLEETEEDIFKRLNNSKNRKKKQESLMDTIKRINKERNK